MRLRIGIGFLVIAMSVSCWSRNSTRVASAAPTRTSYCLADTDFAGQWLIESAKMLRHYVMPDSLGVDKTAGILTPSSALVVTVVNEAKCSRAARALDSIAVGKAGTPVHLVTIGAHYLVYRHGTDEQDYLDSLFTSRARYVGQ